jgi:hypothetical protein
VSADFDVALARYVSIVVMQSHSLTDGLLVLLANDGKPAAQSRKRHVTSCCCANGGVV